MTRLWVCGRCVIFVLLLVMCTATFFWLALHNSFMVRSMQATQAEGALSPWGIFPSECLQLGAVGLVSLVMVYVQRRLQKKIICWRACLAGFLMHDRHWLCKLLSGMGWGCVWACGVIGLIGLCGGYHFHYVAPSVQAAIVHMMAYAVTFFVVGLTEELLFRGYLYAQLRSSFRFQWTAFITSLLFGLVHLPSGTPLMGVCGVVLVGYVFCFMVRHTGSVFFPVGFHAAWDWTQTAVFGVNDSGHVAHGSLLQTVSQGPSWLTGGSDGPEASFVCFVAYGMLIVFYNARYRQSL